MPFKVPFALILTVASSDERSVSGLSGMISPAGLGVAVGVGRGVGVRVGVLVGLGVAVGVGVLVGLGVLVGAGVLVASCTATDAAVPGAGAGLPQAASRMAIRQGDHDHDISALNFRVHTSIPSSRLPSV